MFGTMPRKELRAVPLSMKPDLSGNNDVGAAFSETTCNLYFFIEGSSEIGMLSFVADAYRAVRTDCNPYIDKDFSFLLEVVGSDWSLEMDNWVYLDSRKESWFLDSVVTR